MAAPSADMRASFSQMSIEKTVVTRDDALKQLSHIAAREGNRQARRADRLIEAGLNALIAGVENPSLKMLAGLGQQHHGGVQAEHRRDRRGGHEHLGQQTSWAARRRARHPRPARLEQPFVVTELGQDQHGRQEADDRPELFGLVDRIAP